MSINSDSTKDDLRRAFWRDPIIYRAERPSFLIGQPQRDRLVAMGATDEQLADFTVHPSTISTSPDWVDESSVFNPNDWELIKKRMAELRKRPSGSAFIWPDKVLYDFDGIYGGRRAGGMSEYPYDRFGVHVPRRMWQTPRLRRRSLISLAMEAVS
jgi:hypothetical protein